MFKYTLGIKTTLLELHRCRKSPLQVDFVKTSYNDFVLPRSEFLRHIGAPNESLRLIIINYMFKYTLGIKTTLLESLRNQKSPLKGLVSQRTDFLRLFGAQNQPLRHIIIQYMFKYSYIIKTTLREPLRSQKGLLIVQFRQNQS